MAGGLLERVQRVPFWVRAPVTAFVLVAPFVAVIAPGSEAILLTNQYNPGMGIVRTSFDLLYQALLFGVLLYMLLAIRYIRHSEAKAALRMAGLLDDPASVLERAFQPVRWLGPPIAAAALFLTVFVVGAQATISHLGPWDMAPFLVDLVLIFCRFVITYTFVWTYFASIVGLARVCRHPLRLQPYHRDRLLGTRPLGQLSLSLAATFLIGLALSALWVATGNRSPFLFAIAMGVAIVGLVLFFLPLYAVHVQMRAHKASLMEAWATRYEELFLGETPATSSRTDPAPWDQAPGDTAGRARHSGLRGGRAAHRGRPHLAVRHAHPGPAGDVVRAAHRAGRPCPPGRAARAGHLSGPCAVRTQVELHLGSDDDEPVDVDASAMTVVIGGPQHPDLDGVRPV